MFLLNTTEHTWNTLPAEGYTAKRSYVWLLKKQFRTALPLQISLQLGRIWIWPECNQCSPICFLPKLQEVLRLIPSFKAFQSADLTAEHLLSQLLLFKNERPTLIYWGTTGARPATDQCPSQPSAPAALSSPRPRLIRATFCAEITPFLVFIFFIRK